MKGIHREDIEELQKQTGNGVIWCKRELLQKNALEAISDLSHVQDFENFKGDLIEILTYLANRV